jgi:hypothetical protein
LQVVAAAVQVDHEAVVTVNKTVVVEFYLLRLVKVTTVLEETIHLQVHGVLIMVDKVDNKMQVVLVVQQVEVLITTQVQVQH